MQYNTDRIRTSHVGRLPTPKGLEDVPARLANVEVDHAEIEKRVVPAIAALVQRQAKAGIDIVNDGEFWTTRGFAHYAAHFDGLERRPLKPGEFASSRETTRERDAFPEFYGDMDRAKTMFFVPGERPVVNPTERVVVRAPLKSKGADAIKREIGTFKEALAQLGGAAPKEAFLAVLAPGWLDHFIYNEFYKTEEEFLFAMAEAIAPEYKAVVDAGFILQIDDPGLPDWWDMLKPEPTIEAYRKFAGIRIDAVNHALRGIPEDKVRYHLCWGSWHGPHVNDIPLRHIVDLVLRVKAQCYSFEAGNVRHEHEWKVWKEVKVPAGKMLMPGVVSHATN
ncbi:MAG TPA: hypothetical protein VL993_05505, partial [Stellaceae bacterium]|nr:hypothetical protein [Stellaceae bacterium]